MPKNDVIHIRAYYDAHMAPQRISGPKMLCWGFVFGLFAIAGFVLLCLGGCAGQPINSQGAFARLDALAVKNGAGISGYCFMNVGIRDCTVRYTIHRDGADCEYKGDGSLSLDAAAGQVFYRMKEQP